MSPSPWSRRRYSRHSLPYLAIIAAVCLWGGSFTAMRDPVRLFGPSTVMAFRMVAALIVLIPFAGKLVRSFRSSYRKRDAKYLLMTAVLQPCLYFLLEANALRFTSATQAGLISATVPLLTATGAYFVLKEPLGVRTMGGLILAVAGVSVLTLTGTSGADAPNPLLGNLMELGAMICAAISLVAIRGLSRRYDPWVLTALQTVVGTLFFLPGFLPVLRGSVAPEDLPLPALIYLGVGVTLAAFGLYNWGMSHVPAARASSFINLVPVVAAVIAWAGLGEKLTAIQWLAGVVVLVGVLVSQGAAGKKPLRSSGSG